LIIGNSAGGVAATESIREVDRSGTITIISDEPYPAYSRPLISEYLAKKRDLEGMLFRPADFYESNNVRVLLGCRVKHVNVDEHTVELTGGRSINWARLLLATGGVPIVPPTEGFDLNGVFTFTTLGDAKAVDQFLGHLVKRPIRAVVVGGGLIGMSVAEALLRRGIEVTIVEMKARILNTILDEEASALVEEGLRRNGAEVITGHTVAKATGSSSGDVTGVTLDDGRSECCELVIVAIGVRPRVEQVLGTGIEVNRGIVVDRHMSASVSDIYACGDVAEAYDFVYGENRLTPIWPNAFMGGRVAGLNMAGVPTEYEGGTAMNSLKYFGLAIVSAGMATAPDDSYEVLISKSHHVYRKVVLKDDRVLGMVFAGDIEKSGIIFNLIKDGVRVDDCRQALIADDFGLASLRQEIWRPRLEMPPSARASAIGSFGEPEQILVGE